eukprot:TRINITY_DN337_c1_g1_i1.p1 TRINITY_DN337_c1_g1~~TRINITY_DN337_c1_g1_i1.p1  ORF type:complete len:1453 (-),score=231.28 TRINITY_DN337_c1_g1_i1:87-4445(-)
MAKAPPNKERSRAFTTTTARTFVNRDEWLQKRQARSSKVRSSENRIFFVATMFFGWTSFVLLIYAIFTPYWFLINPRPHTRPLELRVLGPNTIREGYADEFDPLELSNHRNNQHNGADADGFATRSLAELRDNVCSDFQITNCGVECDDMELLRGIKVPCDEFKVATPPLPVPIKPSWRLIQGSEEEQRSAFLHAQEISVLRDHCRERQSILDQIADSMEDPCPVGYKHTKQFRCHVAGRKWNDVACKMDPRVIGHPLYNVSQAPTYVHVAGWAEFQARYASWCSVRELRCKLLEDLTFHGETLRNGLLGAIALLIVASRLGVSRWRYDIYLLIGLLYALIAGMILVICFNYQSNLESTLSKALNRRDFAGRPYVHAMKGYGKGRLLGKDTNLDSAEWTYLKINAHVSFTVATALQPSGVQHLWGFYTSIASGVVAMMAAVTCIELHLSVRGISPICCLLGLIVKISLIIPGFIKYLIDEYLAPYPVLHVYPWQKLYPTCFTCGTWLPWPFDQIWDVGICLPVHLVRSIWDYVSCQDICSPAEKSVLLKKGIRNDRLQSLLCSRRSYFVVMGGLGLVNFWLNAQAVIDVSHRMIRVRQSLNMETQYPAYRCDANEGVCPGGSPDPTALFRYGADMGGRVVAIIREGTTWVDTCEAIMQWLANFFALCCAWCALANWTDFTTSRRYCVIGWLAMMMMPAVTCMLNANGFVNWDKVEGTTLELSAEVMEEVSLFFGAQPCKQAKDNVEFAMHKADRICSQVLALEFLLPSSAAQVVTGCKSFSETRTGIIENKILENATAFCKSVEDMVNSAPQGRENVKKAVRVYMPTIIDIQKGIVGIRQGLLNMKRLIPAVMSMIPALMQGGLMIKNMLPRQTLPSILTTLPWAYTTLYWVQYQLYYQILGGFTMLFAGLLLSFGPMVYFIYGSQYKIVQPMDDQQSITLTFRIWYYALIGAMIIPYGLFGVYIVYLNSVFTDQVWASVLDSFTAGALASTVSGTMSSLAYTLQAGIDWFVGELVTHHMAGSIPMMLASTRSQEEAEVCNEMLQTEIDLDTIAKGTYVCGGLGDPDRLHPPEEDEAGWQEKAQIYSVSLAYKDFTTLDAFAGHIYSDPDLGRELRRARRKWFALMTDPPEEAYVGKDKRLIRSNTRTFTKATASAMSFAASTHVTLEPSDEEESENDTASQSQDHSNDSVVAREAGESSEPRAASSKLVATRNRIVQGLRRVSRIQRDPLNDSGASASSEAGSRRRSLGGIILQSMRQQQRRADGAGEMEMQTQRGTHWDQGPDPCISGNIEATGYARSSAASAAASFLPAEGTRPPSYKAPPPAVGTSFHLAPPTAGHQVHSGHSSGNSSWVGGAPSNWGSAMPASWSTMQQGPAHWQQQQQHHMGQHGAASSGMAASQGGHPTAGRPYSPYPGQQNVTSATSSFWSAGAAGSSGPPQGKQPGWGQPRGW